MEYIGYMEKSAIGYLFVVLIGLTIGSFLNVVSELIVERTRAGLEAARKLGRKGGRRPKMTAGKIESARRLLETGMPAKDVARSLGVSVPTLYRWLPASKQDSAGEYIESSGT